jgi:hypothetical protein
LPDQAIPGKQYSYSNETLFFGNYVVRHWTNYFDPFNIQVITISTIGQIQAEVKHIYIDIGELSGVDITGDGKPEIILYGSDGGNQCGGWVYIFSLGNELKEIGNRIIRCRDYFKDLNNDGIYEYITTTELPMSLSSLYRILQKRDERFAEQDRFKDGIHGRQRQEKKEARFSVEDFKFDTAGQVYLCPQGKELTCHARNQRNRHRLYDIYHAQPEDCAECPARARCLSKATASRLYLSVRVDKPEPNVLD